MANAEDIDTVRLIISDPDGPDALLDEYAIAAFVDLNGGNLRLAAADALDAIAISETLVSKKIRTQTLTTDGPAVSAELRALADRQRALAQAVLDAEDEGFFDVVDTLAPTCRPELTEHPYTVWGL